MEKLSRKQIEKIGNDILLESDIIAKHGTTIKNGLSIIETGFNYHRTSMVIQNTNNVIGLCTYGWKETPKGDSANIIISIPKSFLKSLLGYDDDKYLSWISNIKNNNYELNLIDSLGDIEYGPMGLFNEHIPVEFIRGMFVYTDNKNYLSFLNNFEEGINYLTYIDNPNFYENLNVEEKKKFVDEIRRKKFTNASQKEYKNKILK